MGMSNLAGVLADLEAGTRRNAGFGRSWWCWSAMLKQMGIVGPLELSEDLYV